MFEIGKWIKKERLINKKAVGPEERCSKMEGWGGIIKEAKFWIEKETRAIGLRIADRQTDRQTI